MFVGRTHPSLVPNAVRALVSIVGISVWYRPGPRLLAQREGHLLLSIVSVSGASAPRSSVARVRDG